MLRFPIKSVVLCCAAMATGMASVHAQTPRAPEAPPAPQARDAASPEAPGPAAPLGERSPEQTVRGVARSFLLTPAGDVNGLLLDDGTQVDVPPHLGAELSAAVRLRDGVEVTGMRAAGSPLVRAVLIKDLATSRVVRVDGAPMPTPPGRAAAAPALSQMTVEGPIAALLYTPRGDVGGVVMHDGTQVRFPPAQASERGLAVGKPLYARGFGTQVAQGRAMEATAIGPDAAGAQAIFAPPAPRPGAGPAGRGPGQEGGPPARADVGPDRQRPPAPLADAAAPPRLSDPNGPPRPGAVR
jgi:hypothetical protein